MPGFTAEVSLRPAEGHYRQGPLAIANARSSALPAQDGGLDCVLNCIDPYLVCLGSARDEFDRCWCRNDLRICRWWCTGTNNPLEWCVAPNGWA